jgi:hypothetical protein
VTITRREILIAGSAFVATSLFPGALRAQYKLATLTFDPISPVYAPLLFRWKRARCCVM